MCDQKCLYFATLYVKETGTCLGDPMIYYHNKNTQSIYSKSYSKYNLTVKCKYSDHMFHSMQYGECLSSRRGFLRRWLPLKTHMRETDRLHNLEVPVLNLTEGRKRMGTGINGKQIHILD